MNSPAALSPPPPSDPAQRIWRLIGLACAGVLLLGGLYLLNLGRQPARVDLRWETGSESDTVGFNLWRRAEPSPDTTTKDATTADTTSPDTTSPDTERQVNETLIPAQGSSVEGAAYHYVDAQVTAGGSYRYQIEELDRSGGRRRLPETIRVTVPDRRVLLLTEGLVVLAVGLFLLRQQLRPPDARP